MGATILTIRLDANLISGLLITLLSSVAYGTVAILIKLAYSNEMQMMDVLLSRYVVATICVFIFAIWKNPQFLQIKRSALWRLLQLAVCFLFRIYFFINR
jgi:drug/metabolite transporter (DMT)-like permease